MGNGADVPRHDSFILLGNEVREMSEWSAVTEGVPEDEAWYLCVLDVDFQRCDLESAPYYHLCFWYADEKCFQHRRFFYEVTHWMQLPKMPEIYHQEKTATGVMEKNREVLRRLADE